MVIPFHWQRCRQHGGTVPPLEEVRDESSSRFAAWMARSPWWRWGWSASSHVACPILWSA